MEKTVENKQLSRNDGNTMLHAVSIVPQLDRWIEDCEKQVEIFTKANLMTSAMSSQAMAQAYWNVKQLIEVNCMSP